MPCAQSDAEWRISKANARMIVLTMFSFSCASKFLNQVAVALHAQFLSWSTRYLSRPSSRSMLDWQAAVIREGELLATRSWRQLLGLQLIQQGSRPATLRALQQLINHSEAYMLRIELELAPWPGRGSRPWGANAARDPSPHP